MKRRKVAQQGWALFMLGLVFSNCIQAGLAGRMQLSSADQNDLHQQYRQQQNQQQQQLQHQQYYVQEARQADDGGLLTTVINLALQYGPTLYNTFFGGDGTKGPSTTDRVEDLEIKEEDPFSTSNLISMAIKVALALFTSATSDGIDKSDVTPTQSILGIVISALTGSQDPSEVAVMAKQASEIVYMFMSLGEALQTSFSSS